MNYLEEQESRRKEMHFNDLVGGIKRGTFDDYLDRIVEAINDRKQEISK